MSMTSFAQFMHSSSSRPSLQRAIQLVRGSRKRSFASIWSRQTPTSQCLESRRVSGSRARSADTGKEDDDDERNVVRSKAKSKRRGPKFKCLTKVATAHNEIVILEAPETSTSDYAGSRILLLDNSGNVHSIYKPDSAWTRSYWDEFSSLPAVIPAGPVAIFGLAGGTAARLLLELWPSLRLEGFEIDEAVVEQARLLLGLSDLETPTSEGGCLFVHVQDAFSSSATVDGGFAGIIVDLFSEGEIAEELQQPQAWLDMQKRLKPGGRVMVNCGGICLEKENPRASFEDGTWTWHDGGATKQATLQAMASAFQGQLNWRKLHSVADNCMALSGPLPDLESWAAALPERLKEGVFYWRRWYN